jgi:hypothetical protein
MELDSNIRVRRAVSIQATEKGRSSAPFSWFGIRAHRNHRLALKIGRGHGDPFSRWTGAMLLVLLLGAVSPSTKQPEFPIWTSNLCIVCFSCPGHDEFATRAPPSKFSGCP